MGICLPCRLFNKWWMLVTVNLILATSAATYEVNSPVSATAGYHLWDGIPEISVQVGPDIISATPDTSLSHSTLLPSIATAIHLKESTGPNQSVQLIDQKIDAKISSLPSLVIGNSVIKQIPVALINTLGLLSPQRSNRPDGPSLWLGNDFLEAYQIVIDPAHSIFELMDPRNTLPSGKGVVTVPFTLKNGQIHIDVVVAGKKPYSAILATSAPVTLLPLSVVDTSKLPSTDRFPVVLPDGSKGMVSSVSPDWVGIGGAKVLNPTMLTTPSTQQGKIVPFTPVVGMDFLSHFRVTIDYASKKMTLQSLTAISAAPSNKMSGSKH